MFILSRFKANALFVAIVGVAIFDPWSMKVAAQTRYTSSWASVDQHKTPAWFQDAKFGIYYHWGAFATAMYGSEWYPRNMYNKAGNSNEYKFHLQTYGDPFADWPYNKFLTGANDKSGKLVQFAPKLKSDGGAWDPDQWAQMFIDAGARFAGPVGEHHDGFSNWDSKVNEWNSVAMGPKLNLVKLQADAFRKKGLKFLVSMHHTFHFIGYYGYAPKMTDPSLQKLFGQLPAAQEQQIWSDKLKELIDEFLPDVIWQDAFLYALPQERQLGFLSTYYNAALDANKEVVATAKDGIVDNENTHPGQVYDYEGAGPTDIVTPLWLSDQPLSGATWSYTTNMPYYSTTALLHTFIDRVSKGGVLLLNMSPMPDGTFPQQQKDILQAFGSFLKQAGTAIYSTRPWQVYGEGPTKMGGSFGATAATANDVRYTKSQDGDAVYAILLGWPGNGKQITLASVTTSRLPVGSGKVFLFGPAGGTATSLSFTQDGSGLHVTLPSASPGTALAYAMKISKSGVEPAPTPWIGPISGPDGGVGGNVGTDAGQVTDGRSASGGGGGSSTASSSSGAGGYGGSSGGEPGGPGGVRTGGSQSTGSGASSSAGGMGRGGTRSTGSGASSSVDAAGSGGTRSTESGASSSVDAAGSGGTGGKTGSGTSSLGGSSGNNSSAMAGHGGSASGGNAGAASESKAGSTGCSCATVGSASSRSGGFLLLTALAIPVFSRRRPR
jgi:alpha-L-fucosidase